MTTTQNPSDETNRTAVVMETDEAFCPSSEDIERWMDSAFDMVGGPSGPFVAQCKQFINLFFKIINCHLDSRKISI